jgi:hypothetical protein
MGFVEMFVLQVILLMLLEALRPKEEQMQPSALGDFSVPTAQEDRVVPIVFGTVRMNAPNVIWYGDYDPVPHTKRMRTGLFSKEDRIVGYKYHLGMVFGVARGEIDSCEGIYVDDHQVWPSPKSYILTNVFVSEWDKLASVRPYYSASDTTSTGSGYTAGDVLTVSGGTANTTATLTVNAVGTGGEITSVSITNAGQYDPDGLPTATAPTNWAGLPYSNWFGNAKVCTVTGGTGTGARFAYTVAQDTDGKDASAVFISGRTWGTKDASATSCPTDGTAIRINCEDLFGGTDDDQGRGGVSGTIAFRPGTSSQVAPPYLDEHCQINGETVQYRGTCYAAPVEEPLYLGMSTSIKKWAFVVKRIPNGLNLGTPVVGTRDANPMNVLYECLTNTEWGMGLDASDIDTASLTDAATTLASEGHGYSQLWDREVDLETFIRGIEKQTDGVLYQDTDGKFKYTLARDDYVLANQVEINETNRISLEEFSRATWSETTNMVYLNYVDGDDDWRQTYSVAQDTANIRVMNGQPLPNTTKFSGVTNAALANNLAWRQLRVSSFPLAKATVTLDRSYWDLKPGQVVRFSDANLGLTDLPMRVTVVNLGSLRKNTVRVTLVQDVFTSAEGSFDPREGTQWTNPADNVAIFRNTEQVVLEAPRALEDSVASSEGVAPLPGRLYVNAASRTSAGKLNLWVDPAGGSNYSQVDGGIQLAPIGTLNGGLDHTEQGPLTLAIDPIFRAGTEQTEIAAQFSTLTTSEELSNLDNLILVAGEFMLVSSASLLGDTQVQLNNVYRAVLDSVPRPVPEGAVVYVVRAGGGMSSDTYGKGTTVSAKLQPVSITGNADIALATAFSVDVEHRYYCPLPPSRVAINASFWATTLNLQTAGATPDAYNSPISITRRNWRDTEYITPLTTDAATIDVSYPSTDSTVHYWTLLSAADGTSVLAGPVEFATDATTINRNTVLSAVDGVLFDEAVLRVSSEHTVNATTYQSVEDLLHPVDVTFGLEGQTNLGARAYAQVSDSYTVAEAGVHTATLDTALANRIEYRVNGGSWNTLIASGNTSGSTTSLSISDILELRHLDSTLGSSGNKHFLQLTDPAAPTAVDVAYAIFE